MRHAHTPTGWRPLRQAPLCKARSLKPTKAHLGSIKWPKARPGPWSWAPRVHWAFGAAPRPSGPRSPCTCGERSVSPTQQALGGRGGGAGPWSSTQTQWAWAAMHAWRTQRQPHAAGPGPGGGGCRALEQHPDPADPGRRARVEDTVSAPCTWHLWAQWREGEALSLHWR